jgi:hypothetical protein
MRTTLQINDQLYRLAKQLANETHRTLTAVIEDSLREVLSRQKSHRNQTVQISLPTFKGNGLQSGIDLDDTSALLEAMEPHDTFGR